MKVKPYLVRIIFQTKKKKLVTLNFKTPFLNIFCFILFMPFCVVSATQRIMNKQYAHQSQKLPTHHNHISNNGHLTYYVDLLKCYQVTVTFVNSTPGSLF